MAPIVAPCTPIMLYSVVPFILREPGERVHLEEDLTKIGCIGLISKPWTVKDKKIVREILTGVSNQYDLTVYGQLKT